jgi:HEPN domain-containing protein
MKRILVALSMAATFILAGTDLGYAQEDHTAQAGEHASAAAVEHGTLGHADVLVQHAEQALQHAQAAEKEKSNPNIKEAIKHLEEAIKHGKMGHAEVATEHAEKAVKSLDASKAAAGG